MKQEKGRPEWAARVYAEVQAGKTIERALRVVGVTPHAYRQLRESDPSFAALLGDAKTAAGDPQRIETVAMYETFGSAKASRLTGRKIDKTVVDKIKARHGERVLPEVGAFREALADRCEAIAHRLLDAMPDTVEEAKLQQLCTSFGIMIDKMQLLKGQPTSISEQLTPEQRLARAVSTLTAVGAIRDSSEDVAPAEDRVC